MTRAVAALLALGCLHCQRPPPAENAAQRPRAAVEPGAFKWQVREIRARIDVAADQQLAGIDAAGLQAALPAELLQLPLVGAVGAAEDPSPASWCGLELSAHWQRLDGAALPVDVTAAAGRALLLQVVAHAETFGAQKGNPEVAERTQIHNLPMPAGDDLAGWLRPRVVRAMQQAAADVLGELWARRLDAAALVRCTADRDTWRAAACAREAGDRHLDAARPHLQKLCADTRKEVAVVAAIALGRLGGDGSVAALEKALRARHPEIAAAALDGMVLVGDREALQALRRAAADHEVPQVRQRAAELADQLQDRLDAAQP